jgi:hypothetical protein
VQGIRALACLVFGESQIVEDAGEIRFQPGRFFERGYGLGIATQTG